SVDPPVLRICIWIWSYVSVSGQCGWYQNVNRELPLGIATVCVSVLSPLYGLDEPSCAAYVPLCGDVTTRGATTPLELQPLRLPVSKPPLTTPAGAVVTVNVTLVVCVCVVPAPVTVIG